MRYGMVFLSLAFLFCAAIVWNINTGSVDISLADIIRIIFTKDSTDPASYNIIWKIRLPRLLTAAVLGGALSLSGFLLQTFFRNPIAGPFVLGISSGAKMFLALVTIALTGWFPTIPISLTVVAAFLGSMLSLLLVLAFSGKILERAGCKHVRFHDLRHTFATIALENGIDIKTLADILGHTTVATTINTYTHSTAEMQAAAAKKIDHAIAGVDDTAEGADDTAVTPSEEVPAFVPVEGKYRKRGTGYVKQLSENCWQGRYSPTVNGERVSRNVYGATEEECEAMLAEKIREVKAELGRA